jgi:hypothetical protein
MPAKSECQWCDISHGNETYGVRTSSLIRFRKEKGRSEVSWKRIRKDQFPSNCTCHFHVRKNGFFMVRLATFGFLF